MSVPAPWDPDAPLRIAYLTYRGKPHVGGQGVYTRHLTKALVDLGHHVEVLSGQPYPVLDERIPPRPAARAWTSSTTTTRAGSPPSGRSRPREDLLELAQFSTGTFSEPLAFSYRALRSLRPRVGEFDLVHDNQCLGYGILQLEKLIPTIVTLHHPITKDRRLEIDHAPNRRKRFSVGRWYSFVKMQGRVASRLPRIVVVSENSIRDIHDDMGVDYDRMRLVPVGVDPELFRPRPEIARVPGRLITTASADVALKGLSYLLEAMAKLRTEGDVSLTIIGKPKDGKSMDLIRSLGLVDHVRFVSGVTDEDIVELYAEAELAVVPSLYEGFSLPAIEAMVTGTALVATDGGALPEVTGRDGETVLACPAGDAGSACRDDRPRSRRRRAAGADRRGRAAAGPRPLDVATLRRADRRAVPGGAGDAGQPGEAAGQSRFGMLTVRSERLADLGLAARQPRARRRHRIRSPRLRARPPRHARRRARRRCRRGRRDAGHVEAMVDAGEIRRRAVRRRVARRCHAPAVRRCRVRRRDHVRGARARPRRHRRAGRDGAGADAGRRVRGDRAELAAGEDQLDAVRRVPRPGSPGRARADLLGDRAQGQAARGRPAPGRHAPRPRPAHAVLVAEVRGRCHRRRSSAGLAVPAVPRVGHRHPAALDAGRRTRAVAGDRQEPRAVRGQARTGSHP